MKDDIIPLSEPVTLVSGQVVSEIKIRKGQHVSRLDDSAYQALTGSHAKGIHPYRGDELGSFGLGRRFYAIQVSRPFNLLHEYPTLNAGPSPSPDRWIDKRVPASSGLGIDHDVLTFIDGPRKCLGYRMGTLE
jgi:hypothetical protein